MAAGIAIEYTTAYTAQVVIIVVQHCLHMSDVVTGVAQQPTGAAGDHAQRVSVSEPCVILVKCDIIYFSATARRPAMAARRRPCSAYVDNVDLISRTIN